MRNLRERQGIETKIEAEREGGEGERQHRGGRYGEGRRQVEKEDK